jgi:hypothetical protein
MDRHPCAHEKRGHRSRSPGRCERFRPVASILPREDAANSIAPADAQLSPSPACTSRRESLCTVPS